MGSRDDRAVVFDVGRVLIEWDPRHLYRGLFGVTGDGSAADAERAAAMEHFLTHVCSHTWNLLQDAGRSFADAVAELSERHPEHATLIAAYDSRWEEMVPGAIDGSVEILERLAASGVPLYAITNFSREKFAQTRARFDFFRHFRAILVSAEVRLIKPDPAIYLRLCADHGLQPADCVFIDDSPINVAAAEQVGMHGVLFRSPEQLGRALGGLELLR